MEEAEYGGVGVLVGEGAVERDLSGGWVFGCSAGSWAAGSGFWRRIERVLACVGVVSELVVLLSWIYV